MAAGNRDKMPYRHRSDIKLRSCLQLVLDNDKLERCLGIAPLVSGKATLVWGPSSLTGAGGLWERGRAGLGP